MANQFIIPTAHAATIRGLEFLGDVPDTVEGVLGALYTFGIGFVALASFVALVIAGVVYLSAGDNESRLGAAKGWIKNAIFGLMVALLSYVLLNTINPDLVKNAGFRLEPLDQNQDNAQKQPQKPAPAPIDKLAQSFGCAVSEEACTALGDSSLVANVQCLSLARIDCAKQGQYCCAKNDALSKPLPGSLAQQRNSQNINLLINEGVGFVGLGDCINSAGQRVGASTNQIEIQRGQALTVCQSGCKNNTSTTCSQSNVVINEKIPTALLFVRKNTNVNFNITSIATGDHVTNSDHYGGNAIDIVPNTPTQSNYVKLRDQLRSLSNKRVECEDNNGNSVTDCGSASTHIHASF